MDLPCSSGRSSAPLLHTARAGEGLSGTHFLTAGFVRAVQKVSARNISFSSLKIGTIGWNCNGRKLATGSTDETVKTWSVDMFSPGRDKRDAELQIGREANALCWSPDNPDQLATSAADNLIKLWDVRASKLASSVKLKKSAFLFLAWNPGDPSIIAAVQQDSEVFFIDVRKQKVLKTLPSKGNLTVNQIMFSSDGKLFLRTISSGGVEVYSYPNLVRLHCLMGHAAQAHSIALDPIEGRLASGGTDATVSVFELQTLTCLRSFCQFDHPARGVSFSVDGSYLAYFAESSPGVYIERLATGERAVFLPTQQPVADLSWNPKHLVLAYTGSFLDAGRSSSSRFGNFVIYAPKKE